jgi:hypothetical protein
MTVNSRTDKARALSVDKPEGGAPLTSKVYGGMAGKPIGYRPSKHAKGKAPAKKGESR